LAKEEERGSTTNISILDTIKWIYLGKEPRKPDLIIKLKENYFPIRKSPYFSYLTKILVINLQNTDIVPMGYYSKNWF
jgi:hypothetical protein